MKSELTPDLLPAVDAFARVARLGSFTRAAAELGVSPSALSQSIRNLETRIGLRLLNRTTRSVGLSEAGEALLKRVRPALETIATAVTHTVEARGTAAGTLRINLTSTAVHSLILPMLGEFLRSYPQVKLELIADDAFVDLVAGGYDAGIRFGEQLASDMIAVRVGLPVRSAVIGSPDYFARHPKPRKPSDLHQHSCLRYRFASTGVIYRWEFERRGKALEIDVDGPLLTNDVDIMLGAIREGLCLGYLMEDRVAQDLASGALMRVLEDWCPPYPGFYLYYPAFSGGRAQMPLKLRVFIDFLQARLA